MSKFNAPIFQKFERTNHFQDEVSIINFMGAKFKVEYDSKDGVLYASNMSEHNAEDPSYPMKCSEDYYEWISILETIVESDAFVMLDLGAGYGRWGINALAACQRLFDKKNGEPFVICVEADPVRFNLMIDAFELNGFGSESYDLLNVGARDVRTKGAIIDDPLAFGAYIMPLTDDVVADIEKNNVKKLYGADGTRYSVVDMWSGAEIVEYAAKKRGYIDIINMDIQGNEINMLVNHMDSINKFAKHMHISTHEQHNEERMYDILIENGWSISRFHRLHDYNCAEYGKFKTNDGVIYCHNSRFF